MRPILAIARLTFAEGVRMRIVLVFLLFLVASLLIVVSARGDGTVAGRLKNFLDYALASVAVLLSLTTIFFSCATLSGEFTTRTMHLLVTKPVTRLQILAGKWLGVNLLNLLILLLCGITIYVVATSIRNQPRTFRRDDINIRDAVWTARMAANPKEPDFIDMAFGYVRDRISREGFGAFPEGERAAVLAVAHQAREAWLRLPTGEPRIYEFSGLRPPEREDIAYQVRYKVRANPLPPGEQVTLNWMFVDPDTREPILAAMHSSTDRSGDTHQFLVRASGVVRDGRAALLVMVPRIPGERPYYAFFEGLDGLQVVYKVGEFEPNYLKALLLIFLRLAFLSALGLLFCTFVSFPVACFCVSVTFILCLFSSWVLEAIGANLEMRSDSVDPYGRWGPLVRLVLTPLMRFVLPDFGRYDGVQSLINGIYVPMSLIVAAGVHTLLAGVAMLALPGWLIFSRREVAEVQV